ncbi:MAG: GntR family transcriptional regulator [Paracoccus sp. (in: a-proteobacteria)]|jgi:DNA-binding GntR family transcriptional regulator|uniref:GntR family transcriptional regulator n=1 Tax=unclassified Paracoccus (in: a-proteobacteria) TaxID=2688777 RepID=UPI0017ACCF49|nr:MULTISPECIES: GntR family transcriptional regulator [unclassified Paracoccus (in: a-proteobacteria)]MDB2552510.1 GntR family transcriptional regulator [Paracoccus sp. (in: a-proteobacteria)]HIC64578.1 GntR family transcriptional regulator [Paracoccus sp. (in: a-proteobacteria)]|tara:strand:- start:129 stop:836 length:708 start_codon:yes stop_codon:yes gene_type:complete
MTPPASPANVALPALDEARPPSVTDQVYDALYERVIDLTLPPGARLSEAEVATQMGVSRQPVRDAFYRLSQMGFILIRPQRATVVTQISEQAIRQAHFIRNALEIATAREAALRLTPDQHRALDDLIARQDAAIAADDRSGFHALDDRFHHDICAFIGREVVWTLIKENKGHMDRARYLSLSYNAQNAMQEHRVILRALRDRDPDAAAAAVTDHLSRINETLERLRIEQPEMLGQ